MGNSDAHFDILDQWSVRSKAKLFKLLVHFNLHSNSIFYYLFIFFMFSTAKSLHATLNATQNQTTVNPTLCLKMVTVHFRNSGFIFWLNCVINVQIQSVLTHVQILKAPYQITFVLLVPNNKSGHYVPLKKTKKKVFMRLSNSIIKFFLSSCIGHQVLP